MNLQIPHWGMIRGPRTEEVRARVEIGSPCYPPSLGCFMAPWLALE
jgi:hypothetical protein